MVSQSPSLLTTTDPYTGYTALHWAAKVSRTPPGVTSLSSAQHDNNEMISCLLSGPNHQHQNMVNKQSHGGYTPLHVAAINKSQKAFSALMMDFKADRKIRDFSGKTATSYLRNVIQTDVELKRKSIK